MKKATIIVVAIALWIGISSASDTTTGKDLPKEVLLGSLSNIYEPVLFNHSEHVDEILQLFKGQEHLRGE